MIKGYAEMANEAWQASPSDQTSEIDEETLFAIISLVEHSQAGQLQVLTLDAPSNAGLMRTEIIWRRDGLDKRFIAVTARPATIPLRRIVSYLLSA